MASVTVRIVQARLRLIATRVAETLAVTSTRVKAIINISAEEVRSTQVRSRVLFNKEADWISIPAARLLVVVKRFGGIKRMRAWGFSLDGHDFYCLQLGVEATLVYDLTTGQWSQWASPDLDHWRVTSGLTWLGMASDTMSSAVTRVVAGDFQRGQLWTVNPDQGYDEDPVTGAETAFERIAIGGLPMRLRETMKVGAVYLTASVGSPQLSGTDITLETSDNYGKTWTDHGTINTVLADYDQELSWRSLGLIKAPGRMFRITDNGATVRLDSLDMR